MHYLLTYHYTADYLQRRGQFRDAHLAGAWAAQERGEMVLGGTAGDPPDRAVFMFDCADDKPIQAFVMADPYVRNGLVDSFTIQPWNTVIGDMAKTPVRPQKQD